MVTDVHSMVSVMKKACVGVQIVWTVQTHRKFAEVMGRHTTTNANYRSMLARQ